VVAEIGIVMASLAVLLASRPPWFMSVLLSGICVVMLCRTYFHTSHIVDEEMVKVGQAEKAYEELRKSHGGADEDQKTIERLDADGGYRRAIAERAKNREGGAAEKTVQNESKH